jgi:hypothetical protein
MSAIPQPVQQLLDAKQFAQQQEIAVAITAKTLDAAEKQGEAAVALVDQAAQIGKSIGAGQHFDSHG